MLTLNLKNRENMEKIRRFKISKNWENLTSYEGWYKTYQLRIEDYLHGLIIAPLSESNKKENF